MSQKEPSREVLQAADTGLELAFAANDALDAMRAAERDRGGLNSLAEEGHVVSDELMDVAERGVDEKRRLFRDLVEASGALIGRGALGEPGITATKLDAETGAERSPMHEAVRELVATSHRSAIRQVEVMKAAGIEAGRIPTVPKDEEFAAHAEVVFAGWDKNGAFGVFEEKELTPRLPYVLDVRLNGTEWAAVFRELTKELPGQYVSEEVFGRFYEGGMSGSPEEAATAAGLRLESQEFIPELRGTVVRQKAAHIRLQAMYQGMNIPMPTMNALVASVAYYVEADEESALLDGVDGNTHEKTFGRLYGLDKKRWYRPDPRAKNGLVPGACVPSMWLNNGGEASAGRTMANSEEMARLSIGETTP